MTSSEKSSGPARTQCETAANATTEKAQPLRRMSCVSPQGLAVDTEAAGRSEVQDPWTNSRVFTGNRRRPLTLQTRANAGR
jgi:hypothetical protein